MILHGKIAISIFHRNHVTNGVRQGRYDPMSCYSYVSLASLQSQISHIICLLFINALTSDLQIVRRVKELFRK